MSGIKYHTNKDNANTGDVLHSKPTKLNIVKVMFDNSEYDYYTSVSPSSTEQDCQNYFVGRMINVASYPKETMAKCVKIEFNNDTKN